MKRTLTALFAVAATAGALLAAPAQAQHSLRSGIDLNTFDRSVRPQDDFYRFVNGAWLETTQIPADRSNYGSFTELADQAEADLRTLIEQAAERPENADQQLIAGFYRSFMDTARVEALALKPIEADLARIAAITTHDGLVRFLGESRRIGLDMPFGFYVMQDARNADTYIGYVYQSGLGLPDRDFYADARFADVRDAYVAYVARMFDLAGLPHGDAAAQTVLAIETELAAHQWDRVRNRDANATYNRYTLEEARVLTPRLDWAAFFAAAGAAPADAFIVNQPSYFEAVDSLLAAVPLADWKAYLTFKLLDDSAPYLHHALEAARFDFHGRTLSGVEAMQPRWKRAVATMDGLVGELIGKEYVARHFKPEAKARMEALVENLRTAFGQSIDELAWMDDATKAAAHEKLAKFTFKIGYPDEWEDYANLAVRPDDLFGNVRRASARLYDKMAGRIGQPVDRGEWFMTPQTVNAYYSSEMNEVVFPAAILQPPFFDVEADDAVNYGAIVAVIGHEFSHGFDDQGSKSDGDGNLRDWWTEASAAEFERRAARLAEQYDAFTPVEGMHVNGRFTLGENIGDLGGVANAYRAYRLSLGGAEAPVIDGFTGDQRFFLGWAQIWRRKYREDELRRRLLTDPHAPSEYRCNGVLANFTPFYEAFGVAEGDGLYRPVEERVQIW